MTDQPCRQGAATVRRESDLSLVAVQGAHGLLNGGALHGAAVHAENWKGQTEAPFTVTFTCTRSPRKETLALRKCLRFPCSPEPTRRTDVFISVKAREWQQGPYLCQEGRGQDLES